MKSRQLLSEEEFTELWASQARGGTKLEGQPTEERCQWVKSCPAYRQSSEQPTAIVVEEQLTAIEKANGATVSLSEQYLTPDNRWNWLWATLIMLIFISVAIWLD
jgi:hypothetical protein